MPQLDFSTFSSQAFWIVVSFLLMWFFMARFIVPKIADIMNQRQRKIDDSLQAATQFKQSAEEALQKYEKTLQKANAQALEIMQKTEEELQQKMAEEEAKNAEMVAELMKQNREKIDEAKRQTMEQIEKISADLALKIAAKIGVEDVVGEDTKVLQSSENING